MSGNMPNEPMEFLGDDIYMGHPPEVSTYDMEEDMDDEDDDDVQSNGSNEDGSPVNANEDVAFQALEVDEVKLVHDVVAYDVTNATFDLEHYISHYSSHALLQRLLFIADHSSTMKHDALFLLVKYIKDHTYDTKLYSRCMAKLGEGGGAELVEVDKQWLEQTLKRATTKREKLEMDLKHYRNNSIHDSIRRGLDDFAEHCVEMGDLQEALKNYSRTRDYCSGPQNQVQMNLNVIRVSIYLDNWTLVQSYVQRAKSIMDTAKYNASSANRKSALTKDVQLFVDKAASQLAAASALVDMANGRYENAVHSFLKISFDHLQFEGVLSERDVGVYTSLCALATYNRQQLSSQLINNAPFKQFLELEPRMLHALRFFNVGDYNKCLAVLQLLQPDLLLDMHLGSHIHKLYDMIRKRGMIAYVSPYSCADLSLMAAAFNCESVESLEDELCQLILEGHMSARIDCEHHLLYARLEHQARNAYGKAMEAARQMEINANLVVLRQAMIRIYIRSDSRGGGGGTNSDRLGGRAKGRGGNKKGKKATVIVPQASTSATVAAPAENNNDTVAVGEQDVGGSAVLPTIASMGEHVDEENAHPPTPQSS